MYGFQTFFSYFKKFRNWRNEKNYINGGLGYGDAKQLLFEKVLKFFKAHREKYNYLQNNPNLVISELEKGSIKAKETARATIEKVRNKIGF